MADISRINAIIAYTDGSISNITSADDGEVFQISLTDFDTTEAELFSWPDFRAFMESIGISLGVAIDVSHIEDITWSVTITDETGTRVVSGFEATGGSGNNSNTDYDPEIFPNFDDSIDDLVDTTATATATMAAVSVPSIATRGSGYVTTLSLTLTGGTFSTAAQLQPDSVSTVINQDETSFGATEFQGTFTGGSGYSIGNENTMSDGTVVTVDAVSTGAVTEFTITTASTTGNSNNAGLSQSGSTGEGATGFSLTLNIENQGIFAASVRLVSEVAQGGEYTVIPSNPVAQGSGTGSGATFNMDWGVNAVTVTDGGQGYESAPAVSFSGGSGSAATATLTDDAVSSVTVTVAGSGHTERTTVTVAAPA